MVWCVDKNSECKCRFHVEPILGKQQYATFIYLGQISVFREYMVKTK